VLENAAAEPEVTVLADFLNACGASIHGHGTKIISIEGVDRLTPVPFEVIPDRIEVGTFLVAAAITGGDLTLKGCRADHLASVVDAIIAMGNDVEVDSHTLRCVGRVPPRGAHIVTKPYPGFPTDMQAQMMALACVGSGVSVITDTIYHDRFTHVAELSRLRASAALILAGLVAEGETKVSRVYHIDRGYERIEEKLRSVGADVERIREEGP
jgi:UDP-N-acetylglucosamine 1-carboxyvinyltransferase